MSMERLRKYARATASELIAHGVEAQPLTVGGYSYTVPRTEGRWIYMKTVDEGVNVPITVVVDGWPMWSQVVSITEYRLAGGFPDGGWHEEKQIWLSPDGDLMNVEAKTGKWDVAESVGPASDTMVLSAPSGNPPSAMKPQAP